MLLNLHLKNFILIEEINIEFNDRINIISGETGSGKSMIVDSILICLGYKSPNNIIRQDKEYSFIELTFSSNYNISDILMEEGIFLEKDDNIIISRKIYKNRNLVKINGISVALSVVKKIAKELIDISSQNDQINSINKNNQINILDEFGNIDISNLKEKYSEYIEIYNNYKSLMEKDITRELSFLKYEYEELEEADLSENEEDEIFENYKKQINAYEIKEQCNNILNYLVYYDNSIDKQLFNINNSVGFIEKYDKNISTVLEYIENIFSNISDIKLEINNVLENYDFSIDEMNKNKERLDLLSKLKYKYKKEINELIVYKDELLEQILSLENFDKNRENLKKELEIKKIEVEEEAKNISIKRKEISKILEIKIMEGLKELAFNNELLFKIDIKNKEVGINGIDDINFLISTNKGTSLGELNKVLSGGEMSRFLLLIKKILSNKNDIQTLIFDEIDTGISGMTSWKIAKKIIELNKQLIVITHLPQIASIADKYFLINKKNNDYNTITELLELNEEEIVNEIARMTATDDITEKNIQNALELRNKAKKEKIDFNCIS